jgi:C4-dicarboxylate-specific signal transduction histidine kinase
MLVNLLTNAKDATEDVSDRQLKISIKENDKFWILGIKDNGKGIPKKCKIEFRTILIPPKK